MTTTAPKPVRIECVCWPDVHLGDGRALKGPIKEGTKTKIHGDVAEVDPAIAELLLDNGQVQKSTRDVTVPELD